MRILAFLAFMLLISPVFPAFVYGDIYGDSLEKINKTVVRVDGSFSYQLVTEKSNYSIFLPGGKYTISASRFDDNGNLQLYAQEQVNVGSEDQRIDLVLKKPNNDVILYGGIIVLLVLLFFLYKNSRPIKEVKKPSKYKLDEDAKQVLSSLDSFEGRATQKEIRKMLGFSDAKLSLILTELENLGYIKKFKRGRANIVKKLNK